MVTHGLPVQAGDGGMARSGLARRRARRIARALGAIEARFGPDLVRRLGAARPDRDTQGVPTGSLGLDLATGIGGLPRGGVTELFGPSSSGKTALLYACLATVQRAGGLAALV